VEQKTFDVGLATNYLVIQYQTYLAQARSTEVAAKGAYAKARVALERAIASTLEVNQVSVQEAQNGRVSRPAARIPKP
jgi:outer membrane protein